MNVVTVARLARLKRKAGEEARRKRAREAYRENTQKGLTKTLIWVHPDDRKSVRDYASWLFQRRAR